MPKIAALGGMSSRGFGEFAQQTSANYIEDVFSTWLYTGTGSAQGIPNNIAFLPTDEWSFYKIRQGASAGSSVTTDSSGNFYVTGYVTTPTQYGFVVKYNSSGVVQWQRYFYGGAAASYGNSVAVNSSGDVYISGVTNGSNRIIKYNSSGTLQWGRILFEGTNNTGNGIAVSAAGDVYSTGTAFDGAVWYVLVAKYNSSGTLQWQRKVTYGGSAFSKGIALDSASNVYVCAQANDGTREVAALIKYNSSGTLQWKTNRYDTGGSSGRGVAVDPSDNVYMSAITNDGAAKSMILKFNSSGTLQWQRKFTSSQAYGVAVDFSGNSYVVTSGAYILKYDTSGVLQWQSQFVQGNSLGSNATIDSSGNLFVVGQATDSSGLYAVTLKLKTATASSGILDVYLVPSNLTDATGTAVESAGAGTSATATATENTGSPTDAAGTATASSATQAAVVTASSGGLVWMKGRSGATDNALYDTARGATFELVSNSTAAQTTQSTGLTGFSASGFSIGALAKINTNAATYASWTFRKQPKFFTCLTYTGNGVQGRQISHDLGAVPGMIIIKRTDGGVTDFNVYHRSIGNTGALFLNSTLATSSSSIYWNNTSPTATNFTVGSYSGINVNGGSFVAYLFAHDAGGFGADGSQNVISCGSYTGNGSSTGPVVTLGYEPQFVMVKASSAGTDWVLEDVIRNMNLSSSSVLYPNASAAEAAVNPSFVPNATGFSINTTNATFNAAGVTFIYMAIRRGKMKTPTVGTSVFSPVTYTGGTTNRMITYNFPVDLWVSVNRSGTSLAGYEWPFFDRILSNVNAYATALTSAWGGGWGSSYLTFDNNTGTYLTTDVAFLNATGQKFVGYGFARASNFFDVVNYAATGSALNVSHNLGVVPELIFVKKYNGTAADWWVYAAPLGNTKYLVSNSTALPVTSATAWNNTSPTSSVFTVGTGTPVNGSGSRYSAYLFASCPGVSKIGTYTGTGSTQTIDCGFTSGARFVLVKRTDLTGAWYMFDTARGMVAGTDPYSLWSAAGVEVGGTNLYTTGVGFQLVSSLAGLNANGGTYIYLAIA